MNCDINWAEFFAAGGDFIERMWLLIGRWMFYTLTLAIIAVRGLKWWALGRGAKDT